MKKIELGQAITILANLGVIGGLIFVGFQLRQDRLIAVVDSIGAVNDSRTFGFQLQVENADVWVRGLAGDSLNAQESAVFDTQAATHLQFYFSSCFRNTQMGTREAWERWAREAALDIVSSPELSDWWQRHLDRNSMLERTGGWETAVNKEIARFGERAE